MLARKCSPIDELYPSATFAVVGLQRCDVLPSATMRLRAYFWQLRATAHAYEVVIDEHLLYLRHSRAAWVA